MSSSTTNLSLTKLTGSENFSNTVLNANWDKVDNGYGTLNSKTTPLYKETNGSATSVANATWTTLAQATLPAGTWLIIGEADYSTDSTGIRILMLTYTASDTNNKPENSVLATGRAVLSRDRILRTNSETTVYLRAYQSSGGSLSCIGNLRCVRINTTWTTA